KIHPDDSPEEHWQALLHSSEMDSVLEVTSTRPLGECFDMADAMMTIASTTSLEAIAAGLPVALINYLPIPWYLPFDESGAVLPVTDPSRLTDVIRTLLFDTDTRSRLRANAPRVFFDELYLQDGKSAQRIAQFIEENLNGASGGLHRNEYATVNC